MKQILLLLITAITFSLTAQNDDYAGIYSWYVATEKGEIIDYKLSLGSDGTFKFTSFRIDIGKNEYSRTSTGSWVVKNEVIHFTSELSEVKDIETLNFTGTTARVVKKSPRNKSATISPTHLQFYKSNIFWIANLKLTLVE